MSENCRKETLGMIKELLAYDPDEHNDVRMTPWELAFIEHLDTVTAPSLTDGQGRKLEEIWQKCLGKS